MKSFILLGLSLTVALSSFAQSNKSPTIHDTVETTLDSSVKQVTDTSKLTFSRVYEDAKIGLNGLGKALKVGSEHVYEILVKQQVVKAILDTFFALVCILIFSILINNLAKLLRKDERIQKERTIAVLVFTIITGVLMLIVLAANISPIATGFFNPEYGAIKDIMDYIK